MELALELKGVTKRYGEFMLDHLSFQLPKGCIMGFIGENGAGKSTTIRLLLDLVHRDDGEIRILGQDNIREQMEIKQELGIVFDECNFPETVALRDVDRIMKAIYKNWDTGYFYNLCKTLQLPEKKTVEEYSRGMKMKLALAAALAHHPKLLILDVNCRIA